MEKPEGLENTGRKRHVLRAGKRAVWIDEDGTEWCKVWGEWYRVKALG